MNKIEIINELKKLKINFELIKKNNIDSISEEKVRSGYINKMLESFGWDLSDTAEVIEEKHIVGRAKKRLVEIRSNHRKPDYQLLDRGVLRLYIDAKNVEEDILGSRDVAFQIRSYGWSSELEISMVTNFETFAVYDTTFKPVKNMSSNYRVIFFTIDQLISDFDIYSQFFYKGSIQNKEWTLDGFSIELHKGDSKSFDDDFLELINNTRIELGTGMMVLNPSVTENQLNYYVQVIISRILFIRILEDLNLEPLKELHSFLYNRNISFWEEFQKRSKEDYVNKYDGALFTEILPMFNLPNDLFEEFIISLYGDTPYRFNVIKSSLIAEIYDVFLGDKLVVKDKKVKMEKKVLSPEGSVPTPSEVSDYICKTTIDMKGIRTINSLLSLKIIDPCVGSGAFLVSAFEVLVKKYKEIRGTSTLNYIDLKAIVINCLYGVDIDDLALEVLKMTMSIRLVTSDYVLNEPIENLLSEFSDNFKLGNTIVQKDANELGSERYFQLPTNYEELFPEIMKTGGFTYLIGNPPYIEPKHFKKKFPKTLEYLKKKYISKKGKSDISLFFIERFFSLINDEGQVGIITQNRFFKTEYGIPLQQWLGKKKYLNKMVEFKTNELFKGKTTYVTCLFGNKKNNETIAYSYLSGDIDKRRLNIDKIFNGRNQIDDVFSANTLLNGYWSRNNFIASNILENIFARTQRDFFTFNNNDDFDIIVGPQVLDSKFFILKDVEFKSDGTITAINRHGDSLRIERSAIRKVLRNDNLRPFDLLNDSSRYSYIIFPYYLNSEIIDIETMKSKYPLTHNYLLYMNSKSLTKKRSDAEEFYRFTREQNHSSYSRPKVFYPMTHKRIVASFSDEHIFGDNSNVNALISSKDDKVLLKAYCVIMNTKLFSLFAISMSGDASKGYRKLNKQFSGNIPVPVLNDEEKKELSGIYDKIVDLNIRCQDSYGVKKNILQDELKKLLDISNECVDNLYNINQVELDRLKENALIIGIEMGEIDWI